MMNVTERQFTAVQISDAAGCAEITFRAWRNRNNLFAFSVNGELDCKYFSLVDACILRVVVLLARQGVPIKSAVWFTNRIRQQVKRLIDGDTEMSKHIAFSLPAIGEPAFSADPGDTVEVLLSDTDGIVTAIDLTRIIDHIKKNLAQ